VKNIDCHNEMLSYHRERVNLSNEDQKEMHQRRENGRTRLRNGLEENGHPLPKEIASQGSYAMKTMIQDSKSEYDIDDGVYFAKADLVDGQGNELNPMAARQRVCDALKYDERLKHPAEVKQNCVRQIYPQGYHIDIPVYRIVSPSKDSATGDKYELASGDTWAESDARAVTKWFRDAVNSELKRGEVDSSQLRRVTKLTKKFARSREEWKAKTTSGICISKLVVNHFVSRAGRDDSSLRDTWKAIDAALGRTLQVAHPVLAGQNLADANDPEVRFFHERLKEQLVELEELDKDSCTKKQALETWDKVFSTTYFLDQYDERDDENRSSKDNNPFVKTTGDAARRNDNGRAFG